MEELSRLVKLTGLGHELEVKWVPSPSSKLEGEVKGNVILIYAERERALEVLYHEFFDYIVSKAIKPYERATSIYRAMVNSIIEMVGEEAYVEKERVIDSLKDILKYKRMA